MIHEFIAKGVPAEISIFMMVSPILWGGNLHHTYFAFSN